MGRVLVIALASALACSNDYYGEVKVTCTCVTPDGGTFPGRYEYGNHIECGVPREQVRMECDAMVKQVPADAGAGDCVAVLTTCACALDTSCPGCCV
jgi:hypothetical protein